MKINSALIIFFTFFTLQTQSQKIELRNLLAYLGYEDIIGMNYNDFDKLYHGNRSGENSSLETLYEFNPSQNISTFLNFSCNTEVTVNKKNIVTSINWELDNLENDKKRDAIDTVTTLLGKPSSVEKYQNNSGEEEEKTIWSKGGYSLICYNRPVADFLYITLIKLSVARFKSPEEIEKENENFFKNNRSGIGSGSFNLSINFLERVIKNNLILKEFEKNLPKWNSYGKNNYVELSYKIKTNSYVPTYNIFYNLKVQNKDLYVKIQVEEKLTNKISFIEVIFNKDWELLSKIRASCYSKGYYLNENLSSNNVQYYENSYSGITIFIHRYSNGYSIAMGKY